MTTIDDSVGVEIVPFDCMGIVLPYDCSSSLTTLVALVVAFGLVERLVEYDVVAPLLVAPFASAVVA